MTYTKTIGLFMALLLSATLLAQDGPLYYYTVHVGAFANPQKGDFQRIQPFGYLYAQKENNSVTRVFMGGFPTEGNANLTLTQVKTNGFPDAFITRRQLLPENDIYAIYVGTVQAGDPVDWADYNRAGKLYTAIRDKNIDIYAGQYPSESEAKRILPAVEKIGFQNPKAIKINRAHIQEVTAFQAGFPLRNIVLAPVEQIIEVQETVAEKGPGQPKKGPNLMVTRTNPAPVATTSTPPPATTTKTPAEVPQNYEVVTGRIVTDLEAQPTATDVAETSKGATTATGAPVAAPKIRTMVKRNSVMELQKILKEENHYTSTLDGLYGKGTTAAWNNLLASNDFFIRLKATAACDLSSLQSKGGGLNSVDHLFDWEELKLLKRVVKAVGAKQPSQQTLDLAATERATLLMRPKALTTAERDAVLAWNTSFWTEVEAWGNKAAILKKWSIPLKTSYLQSQVRLEDYFMDKGMGATDASGLAILTLKTMVEPWLDLK